MSTALSVSVWITLSRPRLQQTTPHPRASIRCHHFIIAGIPGIATFLSVARNRILPSIHCYSAPLPLHLDMENPHYILHSNPGCLPDLPTSIHQHQPECHGYTDKSPTQGKKPTARIKETASESAVCGDPVLSPPLTLGRNIWITPKAGRECKPKRGLSLTHQP